MLMIRYNAAHRGAEKDVFPATDRLKIPVVTFTALRWGALLEPTPEDPPGFHPPSALDCYRFVLSNPSVAVALTAPGDREELQENLTLLSDWRGMTPDEEGAMRAHGDRVYRNAGAFS
jgi:aryl-alcohol dehydrogenase-like predicted oxidoreductase